MNVASKLLEQQLGETGVTAARRATRRRTLRGDAPGPTLIVIGGVHGNEPAGIVAARDACSPRLRRRRRCAARSWRSPATCARCRSGRRYLERDLNRHVDRRMARRGARRGVHRVASCRAGRARGCDRAAIARARGPVYLLDSTRRRRPVIPFGVVGPTAGAPRVRRGVPGARHRRPRAVADRRADRALRRPAAASPSRSKAARHATADAADNLEAVLDDRARGHGRRRRAVAGAAAARAHLAGARGDLPPTIEVVIRHAIRPDDVLPHGARLREHPAHRRAALCSRTTLRGEIRAPFDGVVCCRCTSPRATRLLLRPRRRLTHLPPRLPGFVAPPCCGWSTAATAPLQGRRRRRGRARAGGADRRAGVCWAG